MMTKKQFNNDYYFSKVVNFVVQYKLFWTKCYEIPKMCANTDLYTAIIIANLKQR